MRGNQNFLDMRSIVKFFMFIAVTVHENRSLLTRVSHYT